MKKTLTILVFLVLISGCKNQEISYEFEMKPQGWGKFQNLSFSSNSFNSKKAYSLHLWLEINDSYSENTIDFQLLIESEEGESWNQVLSLPIKNKEGKFLIKPKQNKMTYDFILINNKYFRKGENYSFEIVNLNPKINTKGIEKISLCFKQ